MAFPFNHAYAVFHGDSYGATEYWQVGVHYALIDPTIAPDQALCDALHLEFKNMWSNTAPYAGLFACRFWRFVGTKLSYLGTDGKVVPNSIVRTKDEAAPIAGLENGANTTHILPQGTHVATHKTAIPRGKGSRGRVFFPPVCSQLQSDGRITQAQATAIATSWALLLSRTNTQANISFAGVASLSGAIIAQITSVTVGTVVDTQQRRRRSLAENAPAAVAVTN